jgi:transposase-like protein
LRYLRISEIKVRSEGRDFNKSVYLDIGIRRASRMSWDLGGSSRFAYPEEIRRIIYTRSAIESLNNTLKNGDLLPQ